MFQKTKRKYFEIWGDTQSQNTFLKGLLILTIIINITLLVTVISLASKKSLPISKETSGYSRSHVGQANAVRGGSKKAVAPAKRREIGHWLVDSFYISPEKQ